MERKIVGFLLIVGVVLAFTSIDAAESTYFVPGSQSNRPIEYRNIRNGYLLFKNKCKSCHTQDNDKNAPFLCAHSKTMAGWNRLFAGKNSIAEKRGCLKSFSPEELRDLNDFLYSYASDGKNPDAELGCP